MRCTPEHIHELEFRIHQGDEAATMELCECFMPEIKAATRYSGRMQTDAIQEVCNVLISRAIAQFKQNQN